MAKSSKCGILFLILLSIGCIIALALWALIDAISVDESLNVELANKAVKFQRFDKHVFNKKEEILKIINLVENNCDSIIQYIDFKDDQRKHPIYYENVKADSLSCRAFTFFDLDLPQSVYHEISNISQHLDEGRNRRPFISSIHICPRYNSISIDLEKPSMEIILGIGDWGKFYNVKHFLSVNRSFETNAKMEHVRDMPIVIDTVFTENIRYGIQISPIEDI